MPELLKNIYNPNFFEQLTSILNELIPEFDKQAFLNRAYTSEWPKLELKQRMRHVSLAILEVLPQDFTEAQPYILEISRKARQQPSVNAFPYLFLLAQMLSWSKHPNEHVRRLSSEGCRPRLPWAMAVAYLKKESERILPVLENLKSDVSEYVRRSVANNLNDISKDHPQLVIQTAAKWMGLNAKTDVLLKHACRTLIKQGNPETLQLFGFGTRNSVTNSQLQLNKSEYMLGEIMEFTFTCQASIALDARLQYMIDFARKSGKSSRKVFFLDEARLEAGKAYAIHKRFRLQHYSTRKLYAGEHRISIMLNGEQKAAAYFCLNME
jgi:3-methyladenine DNA glycosylase AlkC